MRELIEQLREWLAQQMRRVPQRGEGPHDDVEQDPRPSVAAPRAPQPFGGEATVVSVTPQDDVPSVIGRIDVADDSQVVLIVPRDSRALRQATAWPHIAAYVRRAGISLGVISPRREVRTHARANGLVAASSVAGLRRARPRSRLERRRATATGMLVRLGVFVAAIGLATVVACYRVPSAVIVVVPPSEVFELTAEAVPNPIIGRSDAVRGIIAVSSIRRDVVTVVSTATSGTTEVGDEYATLELRFDNEGVQAVIIDAGTRVATEEGTVFVTDEDIEVPAGESAVVAATADLPGTDGNVAIGAVIDPVTPLPVTMTVVNRTAGTGGTDQTVPAVDSADVDRVNSIAPGVLERLALTALREEVTGGRLIEGSVTASIFRATPLQQLEEPADAFLMEYVVVASGLWIPDGEAAAYGAMLIREALDDDRVLLASTTTVTFTESDEAGGPVQLTITGLVAAAEVLDDLPGAIAGKSPDAAIAIIEERLAPAETPRITITPDLFPWLWLPRRASSIEIRLEGPTIAEES